MKIEDLMGKYSHLDEFLKSAKYTNLDKCRIQVIPAGTTFVHKHHPVDRVYYIVWGECDVINSFINGRNYIYTKNSPGSLQGEMELLGGQNKFTSSVATAKTCKECILMVFPVSVYNDWLNNNIEFAIAAAKRVGAMICRTSGQVGETTVYAAECIAASILMDQYDDSSSETVRIMDTRETLADKAGTSTRTINRVIQKFKEQGYISLKGGKIYINPEQYQKLSTIAIRQFRR